jgi:hypothetical protein
MKTGPLFFLDCFGDTFPLEGFLGIPHSLRRISLDEELKL